MRHMMPLAFMLLTSACIGAQPVGKRPYEMDWANRMEDDHPQFEDFEAEAVWQTEGNGAVATAERSREQQLFGYYVLKLAYRADGQGTKTVTVRPPVKKEVPADFDAVGLWVYGNNWYWVPDATTPRVSISVLFMTPDGKETAIFLCTVGWKEWFLCHKRLTVAEQKFLHQPGTVFSGIRITNAGNKEDRFLFFDSLTLFKEEFKPLSFPPRARRGIALFPGQDPGVNTLLDKILPFPNREDTILPDSAADGSKNAVELNGQTAVFSYDGSDGKLSITYEPKAGNWTDFTAQWNNEPSFKPLQNGGVLFPGKGDGELPDKTELKGIQQVGNKISTQWHVAKGGVEADVSYTFSLRGKTLVIDTIARGGRIGGVSYGGVTGLADMKDVRIPYYSYGSSIAPAVVMAKAGQTPIFVSGHTDWYLSNASTVLGAPAAKAAMAWMNGGVSYIPKTNGERNDVYERFFVTIGPKFEEHLPNISNPQSPWKHVAGKVLWTYYPASVREKDKQYWYAFWRHGLRHCLVRDHENCWRDDGESFTFRIKAAPKKGGDQGFYDYSRYMQDTLGFYYGPYNNFTDFAPVNEYWSTDMVARTADNQLMPAWARCYAPKPLRGVEYCEKLSPIIQEKFHFSTAYCDVHTSVTPWGRCDYDWRVPGGGTFAQVFYAFGEIMLLQKKAWGGPVYSEGPHFCFYSGLTDGNYAQDRYYRIADRPWLVDFDLRKIHDLECNVGMGDTGMFLNGTKARGRYANDWSAQVDRFLTATAAFGHPGHLIGSPRDMRIAFRGYFLLQQIQSRYTQVPATSIRYADENGGLHDVTAALLNGAINRSQLVVDYADGTHVVANGNMDEMMDVTHLGRRFHLVPNAFECWTDDGLNTVFSNEQDGSRADYADSEEYIYIDGRNKFHAFPKADGVGAAVCRVDKGNYWEIVQLNGADCGFAIDGGDAHAFDYDCKDLGPAKLRRCRGLLYVEPVEGAFSYRIDRTFSTRETRLTSDKYLIAAGEDVVIQTPDGPVTKQFSGKTGERVWFRHGDDDICFVIANLLDVKASLDNGRLICHLRNPFPHDVNATATLNLTNEEKAVAIAAKGSADVSFNLPEPTEEGKKPLSVTFRSGKVEYVWKGTLACDLVHKIVYDGFMKDFKPGARVRVKGGGEEEAFDMTEVGAHCEIAGMSCGGVYKDAFFMHPPWQKGKTGCAYARVETTLPDEDELVFQASLGKRDRTDIGDGIHFMFFVAAEGQPETLLDETTLSEHKWIPFTADLSKWRGKKVTMRLVSDVGPTGNSTGDHAAWADMVIRKKEKILAYRLD